MDKQEEIWRPVKGYEGFYEVSNRGRVRSVGRWITDKNGIRRFRKGKILNPVRTKVGYLHVLLCRDGKPRWFFVHRLVAMAFIPNPEHKPEVNHLNEQKDMNFAENLSWATAKENITWGTGVERRAASQSKAVLALDPSTGQVVREFPSAREAGRNGFKSSHISACCNGKVLSCKGFVWKYKDDYDRENTWTPVKIGMESKPVQAIDPKTGEVVKEFPSVREAGRKGFHQSTISACCKGKRKTHKGYRWRYKPVSN